MSPDGEHTLWLPIWMGDKADTCLEIINLTANPTVLKIRLGTY